MEEWKNIDNHPNYEISNTGKIRSLKNVIGPTKVGRRHKGSILNTMFDQHKYLRIMINGKNYKIHRLVAQAFIPNHDNKPQINHKDGNRINNHVNNLEWCTNSENTNHAMKYLPRRRYNKKLTTEDINQIIMLIKAGKSQRFIAKLFGISQSAVWWAKNKTEY